MTNANAAPASEPAIPNPRADIAQLDALERTLYCHRYAIDEISSLGPVIDPAKATAERGEAVALLEQERVEALCAPEVGPLLDRIEKSPELMGQTRLAQARVIRRDRASLIDVPAEEQAAFTRLTTEANDVWRRAKAANDWASFEPYLDRIVEAMRHMAQAKNAEKDPYDVWLDEFEHGTSRAFYDPFFAQVKDCVVPLLADCMASRHKPDHKVMDGKFDVERQWALAGDLMRLEGVDEDALWLGRTEHPFTGGPGVGFALIASHVYEDNVLSNVFSMLHEGGHTLYEQNVDPAYAMTSLKGGTSMGIHESQSRFFENTVGRSRAFMGPLLEVLRRHAPEVYGNVDEDTLYHAVNIAQPSLIRTEADELTYPLHIMVRYEIERMLFAGEATAKDIPALWNRFMDEYLGIPVPDDTRGCLQDTHWSGGSFGYFPTYALGSAYDAMFVPAMCRDGVDLNGACASGDLAPVRAWLGEHIWQWGRAKDAPELIKGACGMAFDARYYCSYLQDKFTTLYQL